MKTNRQIKSLCALLMGAILLFFCTAAAYAGPLAGQAGRPAAYGAQKSPGVLMGETADDSPEREAYTYLLGDTNQDGTVSVRDALMIQNYKALLGPLTDIQKLSADIDMDKSLTVTDILYIQKYLAGMRVDFPVGTFCTSDEVPQQPLDPPTDPTVSPTLPPTGAPTSGVTEVPTEVPDYPTEPATDPTALPSTPSEPTAPADPTVPTQPEETAVLYLRDGIGGLTENGSRLWAYSPERKAAYELKIQIAGPYYKASVPAALSDIAFYRTAAGIDREHFHPDLPAGQILNVWDNLPQRGENDCFAVTGQNAGAWEAYDPGGRRTIYFDTSGSGWENVYIYGWAFGLERTFVPMEQISDHIYTFTFPQEPIPGEDGFVFLDRDKWDGCSQTAEVAVKEGTNFYTRLVKQDGKWSGVWDVWPGE